MFVDGAIGDGRAAVLVLGICQAGGCERNKLYAVGVQFANTVFEG